MSILDINDISPEDCLKEIIFRFIKKHGFCGLGGPPEDTILNDDFIFTDIDVDGVINEPEKYGIFYWRGFSSKCVILKVLYKYDPDVIRYHYIVDVYGKRLTIKDIFYYEPVR